jgi:catechol 2,3-dioxygenase-like lactoylglutathione lyase family enzyme
MRYEVSRCVCIQLPDTDRAVAFYRDVVGLPVTETHGDTVEMDAGPLRLFLDRGASLGPILELVVPDIVHARDELVVAGCTVLRWDGPGCPCYLRDPFGVVFNLFEEKPEFEANEVRFRCPEQPEPGERGDYVP